MGKESSSGALISAIVRGPVAIRVRDLEWLGPTGGVGGLWGEPCA